MPKEVELVPLTQLESGETGIVTDILGSQETVKRLQAMGISPGVNICKISAMILHGPVVIRIKNTELALGFRMASKILVRKDGRFEN
ncbi:MAG: ferrous iron transport protein A [candidate division WOR-3 bacterium]|nr:ferrous iron transport protein A [candidate division WOR-3 bacterium]